MKKCGICRKECEDDAKTCPACGEASWIAWLSLGSEGLKIEFAPTEDEQKSEEVPAPPELEPEPEEAVEPKDLAPETDPAPALIHDEPKRKRGR